MKAKGEWGDIFKMLKGKAKNHQKILQRKGKFPGAASDKESARQCRGLWVWYLGWGDPLEKEMATHSSVLAWRIPRIEEPWRLQSMGSQRVRHDLRDLACTYAPRACNTHYNFLVNRLRRKKLNFFLFTDVMIIYRQSQRSDPNKRWKNSWNK